jgi:hypothetical protein
VVVDLMLEKRPFASPVEALKLELQLSKVREVAVRIRI